VALLLAGVLAHEALHGVGFMVFARAPFKQLHFGIQWCCITPYAGCRMEMPVSAYRRACALPGIVTGLLPALFGIASGWTDLTLYGALMVGGAGGDMWIMWSVRRLPAHTMVKDSENRVGCEVVQAVTA
jgi:hypothetical protein